MLQIGSSIVGFSPFVKGAAMLGYGMYFHTMQEAATLYMRTFVIDNGQSKIGFVNAELGFITLSIQQGVLKKLQADYPQFAYSENNLILTAQHTHSAPGGYSFYPLYNFPTPGFSEYIYNIVVNAVVESIVKAEANKQAGKVKVGSSEFALDKEVSFQRSRVAYNLNPDIPKKIEANELHLGVNREMTMLSFESESGNAIGSVNWFAVHTTSLSNDLRKVNADNKGYAAKFLENHFKENGVENYVGAFAQGNCGDVSPRFRYKKNVLKWQRGYWYGKFDDDYKSAEYNGKLQFEKALEITKQNNTTLLENIDSELLWVDFTNIHCNTEYANGKVDAFTSPACMGVSFFAGALMDGPGMPPVIVPLAKWLTNKIKQKDIAQAAGNAATVLKYKTQEPKNILFETNEGIMMGDKDLTKMLIPGFVDGSIAAMKRYYKNVGSKKDKVCYTPKILPLQISIIGEVAIAAFPFEITTVSGKRLRNSLEARLKQRGVNRVILAPYANGFSGYITTNEEYQAQMYEGGHTVFGQWSLAALQTKFDELANAMLKPKDERNLQQAVPPVVTLEEMNAFPYQR
jgi:neutral ceramidase